MTTYNLTPDPNVPVPDITTELQDAVNNNQKVIIGSNPYGVVISSPIMLGDGKEVQGEYGAKIWSTCDAFCVVGSHVKINTLTFDAAGFDAVVIDCDSVREHVYINDVVFYNTRHAVHDFGSQFNVNLHISNCMVRHSTGTPFKITRSFAYLFMNGLTIDFVPSTQAIDFPAVHIENNSGGTFEDVHINGNGTHYAGNGDGIFFKDSRALWISRVMSDTLDGIGFVFDTCGDVYIESSVANFCTMGGWKFTDCFNVLGGVMRTGGRNAYGLEALPDKHGIIAIDSDFKITNLLCENNTGYGLSGRGNTGFISASFSGNGADQNSTFFS
jgi:hypothetical protein